MYIITVIDKYDIARLGMIFTTIFIILHFFSIIIIIMFKAFVKKTPNV